MLRRTFSFFWPAGQANQAQIAEFPQPRIGLDGRPVQPRVRGTVIPLIPINPESVVRVAPKKIKLTLVENNTDSCAICLNDNNKGSCHLPCCQHVFHTKCIKTWTKQSRSCPVCRSNV